MKRLLATLVVFFLPLSAIAAPNITITFNAPTNYEDGTVIGADDQLTYRLYCGNLPADYPNWVDLPPGTTSPAVVDMSYCVQGTPGDYYITMTAWSAKFGNESSYSNEILRNISPAALGKVVLPPTIISITVN